MIRLKLKHSYSNNLQYKLKAAIENCNAWTTANNEETTAIFPEEKLYEVIELAAQFAAKITKISKVEA